jgi:hypothetical protein
MELICRSWMNRNKKPLNKEEVFYFTNTILLPLALDLRADGHPPSNGTIIH